MTKSLQMVITIQEIQMESKKQQIFYQKNSIEKLLAQIEELKDEQDFNKRLQNQYIKNAFDFIGYYAWTMCRFASIINFSCKNANG